MFLFGNSKNKQTADNVNKKVNKQLTMYTKCKCKQTAD